MGQSGSWNLKFSDEFNGSSLDRSKWESAWFSDSSYTKPVNDLEDGCYHPKQVSVSGGSLRLKAQAENNRACILKNGSQANYVSGLINSRKTFNFTHGYSEARIYIPGTASAVQNWPAFWTTGQDWPRTGEIDIMEGLGARVPCFTYHWGSRTNHRHKKTCPPVASAGGWNTFAAKWEPGKITVYYNGKLAATHTEGVSNSPHYVILNNGVRDDFGIDAPSTMLVDYVRVWDLPSS